ncbi:MAG TPA: thioredoxin domain-containing protein [Thermoanaerobaculia bacterium]|nr:thioredoxin domain-containing protein [Thermoanaerobaculia bacterium]
MARRFAVLFLLLSTAALAQQTQPSQAARLANEKSRYLRDHAANPVDWRPWGEAAFSEARKTGRPIFLSIGYASCHWCHVMERESFTNAQIAEMLNTYFLPILVDREEHPEVDATYIALLQSMTGSAGWPANFVLTPELKPIVGSSYMKPDALSRLLVILSNRWASERQAVIDSSAQLVEMARALGETPTPGDIEPAALDAIAKDITASLAQDRAPKFPRPMAISFLLRYAQRAKNEQARALALDELQAMAAGAIHDQLGGGFHRYTTDADWREPHFEKMLHDQALLAIAYTEAWQFTKDEQFASVARDTLDYSLRDLKLPDSAAFNSGQDADSLVPGMGPELVEAAFYVWKKDEIEKLLGDKSALIVRLYGIEPRAGNILSIRNPQILRDHKDEIAAARERLFAVRQTRPQPFRDDKVITGWNALMISALARGGAAFDEKRYLDAARSAATFVTTKLWDGKTRKLYRRWAGGERAIDALADDYALLIQSLLDLYESTYEVRWLDLAVTLQQRQDELFWNEKLARYTTGASVPAALRGVAVERDDTTPSANSVTALNLLRLAELTDNATLRTRANAIFRSFAQRLGVAGSELPQLASALAFAFSTPKQVVIAGDLRRDDTRALLRIVNERFIPNRILIVSSSAPSQLALVKEMKPIDAKATAYVCEHYVCKLPTSDPGRFAALLE